MKWFLSLLLTTLALPALAQLPPVPPGAPDYVAPIRSPKHKAFIDSLGAPMAKPAVVPLAIVPLQQFTLAWDYPVMANATNLVFELYFSTSLSQGPPLPRFDAIPQGFSIFATVPWPSTTYTFQSNLPQEFFICRVKDTAINQYSVWNQK